MLDMMRSKNFVILFLFIVATSISIWLVSMPTPNIRNIVTETHKQISHLKDNMNAMAINKAKELRVDDMYLELLGFTKNPLLYPDSIENPKNVPVIVTGVTSRNYENAFVLIESIRKYLPEKQMVIFDLGLGSYELVTVSQIDCSLFTYNSGSISFILSNTIHIKIHMKRYLICIVDTFCLVLDPKT